MTDESFAAAKAISPFLALADELELELGTAEVWDGNERAVLERVIRLIRERASHRG